MDLKNIPNFLKFIPNLHKVIEETFQTNWEWNFRENKVCAS